ncbi:MAG: tetratricopeptide repeat protein [Thiobacillus sp.]|nr:tetratricopeptide repeat protein [Thiobacillus sp.]
MAKKHPPAERKHSNTRRIAGWSGVLAALIVIVAGILWFQSRTCPGAESLLASAQADDSAQYVGVAACQSCHTAETAEWRQSQHQAAMAEASEQSVLGDFNDATFTYAGITSTFSRRDGKFFVRTDGPDGKLADYQIKYTFGVYPLQQYLIEFPDGRLQALSIAWDTHAREVGGQRWFHLYPKEQITHDDELHWTRAAQNWNFVCADCHSTELKKNYDAAANRFQTSWAEINVGCEACHGPGSRHLAWAAAMQAGKSATDDGSKGLSVRLDERRGVTWAPNAAGNSVRSQPRTAEREIEVCAQCHSRRGQIAEGYEAGKPFLDYYRPVLLTSPLYHPDGQQRDEVFIWGSFQQSRMFAKGVTCSDCHNPHSGKLRAEGNAVCATCHQPVKYDTTQHHHHTPGSAGAACAACHMPTTTYMVVDPRHDHSLRVPRPDQSVKFGTPNACNGCHTDRKAAWAAAQVKKWFGHDPQGYQRFAPAFAAANAGLPDAQALLGAVAGDAAQPPIVRATAFAEMDDPSTRAGAEALVGGLRDASALVRLGALQTLASIPLDARPQLGVPLLTDPMRAIRIEAASVLAPVASQLDAAQKAAFDRAAAEYIAAERYRADRPEHRTNLGSFLGALGRYEEAALEFRAALVLDPRYVPAYANFADTLRAQGNETGATAILRDGLKAVPAAATLQHSLGLALVRQGETESAVVALQRAATLDPSNPRYAYVYAVALNSTGKPSEAIRVAERALKQHPYNRDLLTVRVLFLRDTGNLPAARRAAEQLDKAFPDDPAVERLLVELRAAGSR